LVDRPFLHVRAEQSIVEKSKKRGLFVFGQKSVKIERKFLVVVNAHVITIDALDRVASEPPVNNLNQEFETQVKSALPATGNLDQILDSLRPVSEDSGGLNFSLGFRLDPKLASLDTIEEQILVTVEGGG